MKKLNFLSLLILLTLSHNSYSHGGGHTSSVPKKMIEKSSELVSFKEASNFVINKYLADYPDDEISDITFVEVDSPASAQFNITMNYNLVSDHSSCHVMVTLFKKNNLLQVDESGANLVHSQCHKPVIKKSHDHSGHKH